MKTALLVIDVQQALFHSPRPPFEAQEVMARINALSERARAAQVPVFFIQHEAPSSPLARGLPGWALASGLNVTSQDTIVPKTTPDSFLRTELHQRLQAQEVSHLVLCGYASEFCIDTTCRSAAAQGYAVTIAADAHTTHDKPHATAEHIRQHENCTLPELTSFRVCITAQPSGAISFAS